jgi:adenylate cyclase
MPAEQLLDLLNGYYEVLGSVILEHHGTLDKYMGDGIMALFGAPAPLENSSLSAVRCGQAMLAAVEAYGRKAGKDLRVGIGLHTSEVVVGNLGTASFKNYTAVGEGVNLAARIESATRQSDASLLFSAEVKASLPAEMAVRAVGDFSLKGVSRPVPLFALADERTG